MTLEQTRERLLRWLKDNQVKLVIISAGLEEYPGYIDMQVHSDGIIGSMQLYEEGQ